MRDWRRWVLELALGAATLLAILLIVLDFDLLAGGGQSRAVFDIEFAELVSTILVLGLFAFSLHRLRQQRGELHRRLEAEVKVRKALELALLDPLTGLANRRHFDDIFRAAAEKGLPTRHALFLIDVDHFKAINDSYGHPVGDEVLKTIASRLAAAVRVGDLVSRLGGDEMSVVAFNVGNAQHAEALRDHLRRSVGMPMTIGPATLTAAISIGYVLFPEDGMTAEEIFAAADADLYRAKAARPGAT